MNASVSVDLASSAMEPSVWPGAGRTKKSRLAPAEGRVVGQRPSRPACSGDRVEVVAHVVEVEDAAVAPEVLGVGEEVPLVRGNGDRECGARRPVSPWHWSRWWCVWRIQSTLVIPSAGRWSRILPRAEVDQHALGAVADDVDVAGVLEQPQIVQELARTLPGRKCSGDAANVLAPAAARNSRRFGFMRLAYTAPSARAAAFLQPCVLDRRSKERGARETIGRC